jgi:hypothetical protein
MWCKVRSGRRQFEVKLANCGHSPAPKTFNDTRILLKTINDLKDLENHLHENDTPHTRFM